MNKKLLTMVTTGAIAISNMNFAFAEGFMATPDDSEFPMFVDGGFIPGGSVPKGKHPIFKIPNAYIPEIEMLMEEFDDEAVEPGDDIVDDVLSGEEYEEIEIDETEQEEELEDEEIIDEAEMERLEREEHEKELAEKEQAEEDDDIMDEIEKDAEKYDKEEDEVIGGIDDDYYDVGEEPEVKDEDPAENILDEDDKEDKAESNKEKEEVKKSNNKEVVSNENNSNTNVSNNTAGAIDNSSSQDKEIEKQANEVIANADDTKVDEDKTFKELEEYQSGKGNSSGNPKTGDVGIIGSIAGMIVGLGGIILRKKL